MAQNDTLTGDGFVARPAEDLIVQSAEMLHQYRMTRGLNGATVEDLTYALRNLKSVILTCIQTHGSIAEAVGETIAVNEGLSGEELYLYMNAQQLFWEGLELETPEVAIQEMLRTGVSELFKRVANREDILAKGPNSGVFGLVQAGQNGHNVAGNSAA